MLRVMTYNIGTGGVDDDLTNRLPLIHAVVRAACPDVLAVQEANEFDLRAHRRLFAFEAATGLRGLLAPSPTGASMARSSYGATSSPSPYGRRSPKATAGWSCCCAAPAASN